MSSAPHYYPQFFKATRPYMKEFMEGLKALAEAKKLNPDTSYRLSGSSIIAAYAKQGASVSSPDFDTQAFTLENKAALMYGQWAEEGAVIYSFKDALTEALMATGLADVTIDELHFPFDCAYFHFGPQAELVLHTGAKVTGAYVMCVPGHSLRLTLTAPLPMDATLTSRSAEVYDLRILARHFSKNVESAIEAALADDIDDIRQAASTLEQSSDSRAPAFAAGVDRFLEAHAANKSTLSRCFQLIANAICYVTAFPSDARTAWQENTPKKLRAKADGPPSKEAGRALSKLNAMGYQKVMHVGGEFSDAAQNTDAGQKSPHWRRGHWRSQAHGPQMSLRKLIWLRPTRVLGAAASEEPRVYKTDRPTPH